MRAQVLRCRHVVTMDEFAQIIRARLSPELVKLPVVDFTGLEGAWDFDTEIPAGTKVADAVAGLGLKIEKPDGPAAGLVVESANEKPTPNPPGMAENPPPPVAVWIWHYLSLAPITVPFFSQFEAAVASRPRACRWPPLIHLAWNPPLYVDSAELPKSMIRASASWPRRRRTSLPIRSTTSRRTARPHRWWCVCRSPWTGWTKC